MFQAMLPRSGEGFTWAFPAGGEPPPPKEPQALSAYRPSAASIENRILKDVASQPLQAAMTNNVPSPPHFRGKDELSALLLALVIDFIARATRWKTSGPD